MKLLALAALFGGLGVILGAFGAHAIADTVPADRLAVYKTGVLYHLLHALLAVVVAALALQYPQMAALRRIVIMLLAGIVVFSGSLYCLVILDVPILGAITPIGGVLLIAAWLWLAFSAFRFEHE